MLRSNKGSILITTLLFFSIISALSMYCIALSYSNNKYTKLQYEHVRMKELALSGIEVTKSNILTEVKYAIDNFEEAESYKKYFLGKGKELIGDISNSGLYGVKVSIQGRITEDIDGNINFVLESAFKEERYNKRIRADVKIINPWSNYDENQNNDIKSEDIDTTEKSNDNLDENELVVVYNYEEN